MYYDVDYDTDTLRENGRRAIEYYEFVATVAEKLATFDGKYVTARLVPQLQKTLEGYYCTPPRAIFKRIEITVSDPGDETYHTIYTFTLADKATRRVNGENLKTFAAECREKVKQYRAGLSDIAITVSQYYQTLKYIRGLEAILQPYIERH